MPTSNALVRLKLIGAALFSRDAKKIKRAIRDINDAAHQTAGAVGRMVLAAAVAGRTFASAAVGVGVFGAVAAVAAAGVVLLGGALVALGAAGALVFFAALALGAGVVARFKDTADQAGTAANELSGVLKALKHAWDVAISPAAAAFMRGAADGLRAITPLVTSLRGPLLSFGKSAGKAFSQVMHGLSGLGPQLGKAIRGAGGVLTAVAPSVAALARIFLNLARTAMPALTAIARGLTKLLQGASRGVTAFSQWVRSGQAMETVGGIFDKVMGVVTKVFAVAKGAVTDLLTALAPAQPFLQNVLIPLFLGVAKGVIGGIVAAFNLAIPIIRILATALGWIGKKAAPLKGVIQGIGTVIGFIFGGAILKVLSLIPKLGIVFKILAIPIRIVAGVFRGVASAIGWVIGKLKTLSPGVSKIGDAFKSVFGGLAGIVSSAFDAVVGFITNRINDVLGVINGAIRAYNKIPGFIRPGGKIGEIGLLPTGGGAPAPANSFNPEVTKSNSPARRSTMSRPRAQPVKSAFAANTHVSVDLIGGARGLFTTVVDHEAYEQGRR